MDTKILEDLGLTRAEIKVYLALLELGTTTAGPILDKTKLQNSVVHLTLHKLAEKEFLTFTKRGKSRYYQAADPKIILNFIEQKKKNFQKILPELLNQKNKTIPEKSEAQVYDGLKSLSNLFHKITKDSKTEELLFFAFNTDNTTEFNQVYNFYKEFETEQRKKIIFKVLAPEQLKSKLMGRNIKNIQFTNIPIPTNIFIFKKEVIFTPWEEKQSSFLINSNSLAESLRQYFYSLWKP